MPPPLLSLCAGVQVSLNVLQQSQFVFPYQPALVFKIHIEHLGNALARGRLGFHQIEKLVLIDVAGRVLPIRPRLVFGRMASWFTLATRLESRVRNFARFNFRQDRIACRFDRQTDIEIARCGWCLASKASTGRPVHAKPFYRVGTACKRPPPGFVTGGLIVTVKWKEPLLQASVWPCRKPPVVGSETLHVVPSAVPQPYCDGRLTLNGASIVFPLPSVT